jgi:tetratricopeptide (TPR) repeat protein
MKRGPAKTSLKKHGIPPQRPRRARLIWLAAILFLTFAAYIPSLDNEFTNWDDNTYVTDNPLVSNPNARAVLITPLSGNYHPLTIWSLALNYRLSGLNPASYHWLNLLLHLANTCLVFVLMGRLSKGRLWAPVVTSLFFGIHPMHVESVAWVSERKDVLYAFFYLLGLITYLRYLDRRQPAWLLATLLAYVLSALSKPAAVVFPLTLLAVDFYQRREYGVRLLLEKIPFFVFSVVIGILTLHAQRISGAIDPHQWGPFQKALLASYGLSTYLVKLIAPVHLSAIHPYPPNVEGTGLGTEFYLAFVIVAILLPTVIYLNRRNRTILFGLAFFFINIMLVLQVFTLGRAVTAERYTYLPYIGLFLALAWWIDERPAPRSAGAVLKALVAAVLLLLVPVSLFQTWKRCDVWQNSGVLWSDTIQEYPRRIVDAYVNRGHYYMYGKEKRFDAALADFDQAIALNPRVAKVWFNKAVLLATMDRIDSALVCYDRAVEIKPDYSTALNNRGGLRLQKGDLAGAAADYSQSIAAAPGYRDAYANRAMVYSMMQQYEKSVADSRRAIELDPKSPDNYLQYGSMGEALQQMKRDREAIVAFDEAIGRAPKGEPRLGEYYLSRSHAWWTLGVRSSALNDALQSQRLGSNVDPSYMKQIGG